MKSLIFLTLVAIVVMLFVIAGDTTTEPVRVKDPVPPRTFCEMFDCSKYETTPAP